MIRFGIEMGVDFVFCVIYAKPVRTNHFASVYVFIERRGWCLLPNLFDKVDLHSQYLK